MHEAQPHVCTSHVEQDALAPPRQGQASEMWPLQNLSLLQTFVHSTPWVKVPARGRQLGPAHQDTAATAGPMLLLFSVTSVAEKLVYDARVCQGGGVPQVVVIPGNLP